MMQILGEMILGRRSLKGTAGESFGHAAESGAQITPAFGGGDKSHVEQACELAEAAFDSYRALPDARRAEFLEAIAQGLLDLGEPLVERVMLESGLPRPRIEGERMRTVNQLKLFANLLRKGRWHDAVLDDALPERQPPRPALARRRIGLGPVAVFGASNFPLAFSVAGGDTASALAAGCPVVAKAHPAHPGTSELVGKAIQKAALDTGMPEGVFSLLFGEIAIGQDLVRHPAIKAVGFTGSRRGGLALVRLAQERKQPIPVYAEMSSINPTFLLPGALQARSSAIAAGFAASLTMGTGQFCTNPGLVIVIDGPELDAFLATAQTEIAGKPAGTMLTPAICDAYGKGLEKLRGAAGVEEIAKGQQAAGPTKAGAALFKTAAATFLASPVLEEENFGPSSLVVVCKDPAEMLAVAAHVEGQLTATLHVEESDYFIARALLPVLEKKAGRILFNDFPTGVEVCDAMVHGGPYPATSDSRTSSVGTAAIERFLRPVCYQNIPDLLLPPALQANNPLGIWRLRNGEEVQG
jgi:NADP-dependent aldehyde dehydrogenase